MPIENTDAFHQAPQDAGEATNANAEIKFYASLNNAGYTAEESKPQYIHGYEMENWTNWSGGNANRNVLYERKTTPHANLTIYEPIQTQDNTSIPVYFILKGTDSLWEVLADVDLFVDYTTTHGKQWLTSLLTGYFQEQQSITAYIKNYMENDNTTNECVFTGHSLGCKFCIDIIAELVRDHNMNHRISSVRCFNPYVFPGSENYQYCFNQAKADTFNGLFRDNWYFYIIKSDFASVFVRSPNVGFGNVFYFDNVNTDHQGANLDAVRTLSNWMSILSLGTTRQSYLDIVNHKVSNWNPDLPEIVYGGHVLTEPNSTLSISTWIQKSLPNYFAGNTDLRQLFVWKDPNPPAGKENNLTVNIRHEQGDGTHEASHIENFIIIQNYNSDKTTYFKYQIGDNWYVAFRLNAKWLDSSGVQHGTQIPIYIISVDSVEGIGRFVLAIPSTTANKEVDVLRINSGDWNDSQSWNGTLDKENHGSELKTETYEAFIATQMYANSMGASGAQLSKYERSLWRLHLGDVAPIIDGNGRRTVYTPQTILETTFNLGYSSGITNFNSYIISMVSWYVEGNSLDILDNSGNISTGKYLFSSAINSEYYLDFKGSTTLSAQSANGVQGDEAITPDSEVWNISYDGTKFVINNTQITSANNSKLVYFDTGSWVGYYASGGTQTSNGFHTIPYSSFPITKDINIEYHSTTNSERYYRLTFMEGSEKHYLITTTRSYSQANGKYAYVEIVSETYLNASSLDLTSATLYKLADNVFTGQGIP